MKHSQTKLHLIGIGIATIMIATTPVRLCSQDEADEDEHKKNSREMFAAFHCSQNNPASVKAFAGCWRIGQVCDPPRDKHLSLGMRMSERRAQLLIDSNNAQQEANSENPRYCSFQDVFSVAPYPTEPFLTSPSKATLVPSTYAYVILDIPNEKAKEIADIYYDSHKSHMPDLSREEYQRIVVDLARKGGKYIRTFIVMSEDNVWWGSDGEEDFWALPTDCKGWGSVEERLKKKLNPNP